MCFSWNKIQLWKEADNKTSLSLSSQGRVEHYVFLSWSSQSSTLHPVWYLGPKTTDVNLTLIKEINYLFDFEIGLQPTTTSVIMIFLSFKRYLDALAVFCETYGD